jgi:hypothetical protein
MRYRLPFPLRAAFMLLAGINLWVASSHPEADPNLLLFAYAAGVFTSIALWRS